MIRVLLSLLVGFIYFSGCAQTWMNQSAINTTDTLESFLVRKNPPYVYSTQLNHREVGIGNKILRGNVYAAGFNVAIGAFLVVAPVNISKWDKKNKFQLESIFRQYKKSFTAPPVIDKDLWAVNFIGHPLQGSYYYNCVRSQDAKAWHSALFCIGQSFLWEYAWEAGMEQPSIQDFVSTPLAGILVGEASHVVTIKMSRNGFRWYEIVIVCLINPAYVLNNGFRTQRNPKH